MPRLSLFATRSPGAYNAVGLRAWLCVLLLAWQALAAAQPAAGASEAATLTARGIAQREQGHLQQSIDLLEAAARQSEPGARLRALGELGISLLQARRLDEAEEALLEAAEAAAGSERARYSLYLGNVALLRKSPSEATYHFEQARDQAGGDAALRLNAGLNLARLANEGERQSQLEMLSRLATQAEIGRTPAQAAQFAPHHINLGDQARAAGAIALAHRHLSRGQALAEASGNARLAAEAGDAMAQLYEDQRRHADALALTRQALQRLRPLDPAAAAELLIALEWRQGRLLAALGRPDEALAGYERAVHQVESVRQDIPIDYADGRSSFTETLEPIYLGYVDQQLKRMDRQASTGEALQVGLRQVRDTVELLKQTELQDFLGDRCTVEAVQGTNGIGQVAAGTAVLYPIILRDRLELLLETPAGFSRRTVAADSTALRRVATELAERLRNERSDFMPPARQLYDWLLRPVQAELAQQGVRSLVVIPDGPLRLVPMAVLHDGRQFALEQYAMAVTTGLTMTNARPGSTARLSALMVGLSEPGPVLAQLSPQLATQILQSGGSAGQAAPSRSLASGIGRNVRSPQAGDLESIRSVEDLRQRLALPGVKDEIEALGHLMPGKTLLNAQFTLENFRDEAKGGDYRVLHIASHGVFGGSADTSYIMAYDNLLTMDGLQSLLQSEKFQKNPIELLSLSACQTAEGNERAPLGMSGAAIKARAKSVLGTLWPVDDAAARQLMERVYGGLRGGAGTGKSEALRQAQLELLRQPASSHPFYWAPFVLVGNWL